MCFIKNMFKMEILKEWDINNIYVYCILAHVIYYISRHKYIIIIHMRTYITYIILFYSMHFLKLWLLSWEFLQREQTDWIWFVIFEDLGLSLHDSLIQMSGCKFFFFFFWLGLNDCPSRIPHKNAWVQMDTITLR